MAPIRSIIALTLLTLSAPALALAGAVLSTAAIRAMLPATVSAGGHTSDAGKFEDTSMSTQGMEMNKVEGSYPFTVDDGTEAPIVTFDVTSMKMPGGAAMYPPADQQLKFSHATDDGYEKGYAVGADYYVEKWRAPADGAPSAELQLFAGQNLLIEVNVTHGTMDDAKAIANQILSKRPAS